MHETLIETTEREGYKLELHADLDARNPFQEFDLVTRLVFENRTYDFGDRHETLSQATGFDAEDFAGNYYHREPRKVDPDDLLIRYLRLRTDIVAAIGFSFQDYGSSGARATAYGEGDVDLDGFAYVTREDFEKMCGPVDEYKPGEFAGSPKEHAVKLMQAEIGEFSKYLEGEVYGYMIEDPDGNHLDSCWGFYGTRYAEEEAERAFSEAIRQHKLERWEKVGIDPTQPDYGQVPA